MIVMFLIDLAVGVPLIVLGALIWVKQKVSLLHDYHYKNVRQEDLPAYTRRMGIGLILMGFGMGVTGILEWLGSPFWWISLAAGFLIGILVMHTAQKKYNGSWFG